MCRHAQSHLLLPSLNSAPSYCPLWNAGVSPEPRPGHHGARSAKTIDNKHNMATVMSAVSSMSPQTFPGSTTWHLPSPWHHWRSTAVYHSQHQQRSIELTRQIKGDPSFHGPFIPGVLLRAGSSHSPPASREAAFLQLGFSAGAGRHSCGTTLKIMQWQVIESRTTAEAPPRPRGCTNHVSVNPKGPCTGSPG